MNTIVKNYGLPKPHPLGQSLRMDNASLEMDSWIIGQHVHEGTWTPVRGKNLSLLAKCQIENINTPSVLKSGSIIGNLQPKSAVLALSFKRNEERPTVFLPEVGDTPSTWLKDSKYRAS